MHEELEFIRVLGAELIMACGETEKPEVKKSIDEVGKPAAQRWGTSHVKGSVGSDGIVY